MKAPPLCLAVGHTKMNGSGPCLQRSEELIGRNRQENGAIQRILQEQKGSGRVEKFASEKCA